MSLELSQREVLEIIIALKEKSFLLEHRDKHGESEIIMDLAKKVAGQLYQI